LVLPKRTQRIRAAIVAVSLCVLAHNLCYHQAWEYHYTLLFPLLPTMLWLWRREADRRLRRLLTGSFLVSLPLFLPTLYCLAPKEPARFWVFSALLRVTPVLMAFLGLFVYGAAFSWRARRGRKGDRRFSREEGRGERGAAEDAAAGHPLPSPLSPLSPLPFPLRALWPALGLGATLVVMLAAVLATAYGTVPGRFRKATAKWTSLDWTTHLEDVLSRPGVAPRPCAEIHEALAQLYAATQPPVALRHCREAAAIGFGSAQFYTDLGRTFYDLGKLDDAIRQWQKALELDPGLARAHSNLGAALAAQGRPDGAIGHFRRAIASDPEFVDAHFNLGLVLAGRGRIEEAIAHYEKALKLKPDYVEALNELAWLRATCPEAALRDGTAAIELAQRANSLTGGKTPEMLDTLAAAYAEAGMFSKAAETVSKALDLARQQNKTVLVEKLKDRLWLYDVVEAPYRQPRQPPPPRSTGP
jgi:tetratricopeptide (TPR) repeat protein